MHLADPAFPPLLTGHPVKAPQRPFAAACHRAASGELGAGDVVWARNTARAEMAVILEPDVPRRRALQMLALWQVAICDSLGSLLPPQVPLLVRWPDLLLVDGGLVGRIELAVTPCPPDGVPNHMVLAVSIALTRADRVGEPGDTADETVLAEEGAADLDRTRIIQSLSAHTLTWIDTWQDEGFRPIHEAWIGRLEGYGAAAAVLRGRGGDVHGRILGLDDEMRLMVREPTGTTRLLAFEDAVKDLERVAQDGARGA